MVYTMMVGKRCPGAGSHQPGARPTERMPTVDTPKSSATQRTNQDQGQARLKELEDRYRHELMEDYERQELRDRILKIKMRRG
jgi:hypothetical protein